MQKTTMRYQFTYTPLQYTRHESISRPHASPSVCRYVFHYARPHALAHCRSSPQSTLTSCTLSLQAQGYTQVNDGSVHYPRLQCCALPASHRHFEVLTKREDTLFLNRGVYAAVNIYTLNKLLISKLNHINSHIFDHKRYHKLTD